MTLQLTPDDNPSAPTFSYEQLLGLREPPFALTANPRFLFESRSYTAAVAEVREALRRHEPIVVVTGAAGTGKTMVAKVLKAMQHDEFLVAVVSTPPDSADDLLRAILDQLGTMPRDHRKASEISRFELLRTLEQFLRSLVPLRATAVVIVDEAHRMSDETLEQVRSLSNIEVEDRKLLQIVLLAEPEFEARLEGPVLGPLRQRVTRLHTLNPLAAGEVRSYVERRLAVAKGSDLQIWPFEDDAIEAIATLTRGVPRLVNVLCDRALEVACALDLPRADRRVVVAAARHLHLGVPMSLTLRDRKRPLAVVAAVVVLVALAAVTGWALATRPSLPQDLLAFVRGRTTTAPAAAPSSVATNTPDPSGASAAASASSSPNSSSPNSSLPNSSLPGSSSLGSSSPGSSSPDSSSPNPPSLAATGAAATAPPPTPANAGAPQGNGGESFTVLAASFRTPERADAVGQDFKKRGLPARVRVTESGWHQVLIGPYSTRSDAQAARQGLDAAFHDATIVATGATPPAAAADSRTPATPPKPTPASPAAETAKPPVPAATPSTSSRSSSPPSASSPPTSRPSSPPPSSSTPPPASSRGTNAAATPDTGGLTTLEASLKRAEALALVPDVRALINLRTSIAESESTSPYLDLALARVDVLIDQARQRQLENDARQLQQGRGRGR